MQGQHLHTRPAWSLQLPRVSAGKAAGQRPFRRQGGRAGIGRNLTHLRATADVKETEAQPEDTKGSKKGNDTGSQATQVVSGKGVNVEDFDLSLACALGACSFEAYHIAYHMHGLKELHPCGAETIYMDPDYLQEVVKGMLKVHVRNAAGLSPQGEKRECNPFVTVAVGPSAGRTLAVKDATEPQWRETLFMYVRDPDNQTMTIHVEHATKEVENVNVLLGMATITDFKSLLDGHIHDLQFDLEGEGCTGSIFVSVLYEECEDFDAIESTTAKAAAQFLLDDWAPDSYDWYDESTGTWHYDPYQQEEDNITSLKDIHSADLVQQCLSDAQGKMLTEGVDPSRGIWKSWQDLRDSSAEHWYPDDMKAVAFVFNKATSTEAWIYRNNSTREAVVSFRGTSDPQDMMTDAAMSLSAFSPGQRPDSRSPEDVANSLSDEELENGPLGGIFKGIKGIQSIRVPRLPFSKKSKKGNRTRALASVETLRNWAKAQAVMLYGVEHDELWVHQGFHDAYQSVKPRVMDIMAEIVGECVNDPQKRRTALNKLGDQVTGKADEQRWRIFVTGHSMGGAKATLCAYELAASDWKNVPPPHVTMISFGQPRVGNLPFAQDYDEVVPDSWRIKNTNDIVTRIPSLLGYQHIGVEVQLFPDGEMTISRESSDDLREGAFITDILPKIKEGAFGEDPEAKEEFNQLARQEMDVWKSMISGSAVQEHMEDVYHDMLKGCKEKAKGGRPCIKNLQP